MFRSELKSCAQAARPRRVRMPSCIAKDLSVPVGCSDSNRRMEKVGAGNQGL